MDIGCDIPIHIAIADFRGFHNAISFVSGLSGIVTGL
jgi:hypothetical protein